MGAARCPSEGICGLDGASCEVSRLANDLSVPDAVAIEAQRVCAAVIESKLARGKELSLIAVSSLYAACRENRTPVTIRELALESGLTLKEVGRCYRLIANKMEITPPAPNGTRYVDRVATKVGASAYAKRLSLELEKAAVEAGLGDRNPMVVAAAAVYTACLMAGENRSQSEVAEAAGVGEISLRGCAKAIRKLPQLESQFGDGSP